MLIPGSNAAHLTYCLNIHPGETWEGNREAIRIHALAVRDRVAPGKPFGLGLRLGHAAAETLANPRALSDFRELMSEHNLYAFTVNGFPYGPFHGTTVKEDVYRPDWQEPQRLHYTMKMVDILAGVLPDGMEGSISTVPGSYAAWITSRKHREAIVCNLAAAAWHCHDVRQRLGREIHIGLEPEPDCFLERSGDAVAFFTRELIPEGSAWLARNKGCSSVAAETVLRRHIGICFDTCHLAVQFEDLVRSLQTIHDSGIRISKMQISAAIRTEPVEASLRQLRPFVDPVYLHQVKSRSMAGGAITAYPDLTASLLDHPRPGTEWRIHFHVPLYIGEYGLLHSTGPEVTPALFRAAVEAGVKHFEIETYTFGVLPEPLRKKNIADSIAEEYQWVLDRFVGPA